MWCITGGILMKINLLEQGLVMLKVACTSMEAQDAHEDILVIAQVGHRLDILNMRMLPKKILYKYIPVHTSTYMYILVHTLMDIPPGLDTRCYPYFPTGQSREPCAEYCVLSRNSKQPFPLSSLANSSGGGQGGQLPVGARL
jgi:hypothetical protein